MTGTTVSTASANCQLINSSKTLAPTIRNSDETIDAMACETKLLIASTSDVRLVNSRAGVMAWI